MKRGINVQDNRALITTRQVATSSSKRTHNIIAGLIVHAYIYIYIYMVIVIRWESRRINFFYSSGTIPDKYIFFYSDDSQRIKYCLFIRDDSRRIHFFYSSGDDSRRIKLFLFVGGDSRRIQFLFIRRERFRRIK